MFLPKIGVHTHGKVSSILSGTVPDSKSSTNGAWITCRVEGHGLPLLPEKARKGAFFASTMGDSVLLESWLYHWGSAARRAVWNPQR